MSLIITPSPKKPTIKTQLVDGVLKEWWLVGVKDEEYQLCDKYSRNRWSNTKPGKFGKGLANKPTDPYLVPRVGLLGETGGGKILSHPVDFRYIRGGDKTDWTISSTDETCNYKTQRKFYTESYPWHHHAWIRVVDDRGNDVSLKQDIYIFGFLQAENRLTCRALVVLVGWLYKTQFQIGGEFLYPVKMAITGKHKNIYIPYADMRSMQELQDKVELCLAK